MVAQEMLYKLASLPIQHNYENNLDCNNITDFVEMKTKENFKNKYTIIY